MPATASEGHWLYRWVDEFEVNSVSQIDRLLDSPTALARVHELAVESFDSVTENPAPVDDDAAVVVGRTLDISTPYGCSNPDCQKLRIDRAFLSTWHYFDKLVMTGPSDGVILAAIEQKASERRLKDIKEKVGSAVATLLYLKGIGATRHIEFRVKDVLTFCDCCDLNDNLQGLGLRGGLETNEEAVLLDEFRQNGDMVVYKIDERWTYVMRHPALPEPFIGSIQGRRKPGYDQALAAFVRGVRVEMARDLHLSRQLKLPLSNEVEIPLVASPMGPSLPTKEAIALTLEIPSPQGIDTATLLRIMEDEKPHLTRFRAAVRKAVDEMLKTADGKDPKAVGRSITRDYIEPELADIQRKLSIATSSLRRKSFINAGVGTAIVTAGLVTAMPIVVGVGVTALASQLMDSKKYLEDRSAIKLSDMYFLWNLNQRAR